MGKGSVPKVVDLLIPAWDLFENLYGCGAGKGPGEWAGPRHVPL